MHSIFIDRIAAGIVKRKEGRYGCRIARVTFGARSYVNLFLPRVIARYQPRFAITLGDRNAVERLRSDYAGREVADSTIIEIRATRRANFEAERTFRPYWTIDKHSNDLAEMIYNQFTRGGYILLHKIKPPSFSAYLIYLPE